MVANIWDLLKKGLKSSLCLWVISFLLTFILTILSASLVTVIFKNIPGSQFGVSDWIEILILNLPVLVLTHIVTTLLQNFSTEPPAQPSGEKQSSRSYYGYTVVLFAVSFIYFIGYLLLLYVAPSWRNAVIFISSAAVEGLAFYSVFQIEFSHEQARKARDGDRTINAGEPGSNVGSESGDEDCAKDGATTR